MTRANVNTEPVWSVWKRLGALLVRLWCCLAHQFFRHWFKVVYPDGSEGRGYFCTRCYEHKEDDIWR